MVTKFNPSTLIFDWGNTVMKEFPQYSGPMAEWPEVAAVDGILPALSHLDGKYRLIIGTNARESSAEQVRSALKRVNLDQPFEYVFTFAETRARKPEVEFFRSIERLMGEFRDSMVMIGDTYTVDITGAKRAGWKAVLLNPQNTPCPSCMPLHDIEINSMDQLNEALDQPFLPDVSTCLYWLQENGVFAGLLIHVQLVAAIAYLMALSIRAKGEPVNPILAHRGGLLHDLAKLRRMGNLDHGAAAEQILIESGEPALGQIANRHMLFSLLDEKRTPCTWEEKLVYYADKLVEMNELVLIEERIAGLKTRYPMEPIKLDNLYPRMKKLEFEICSAIGKSPEELLVDLQQVTR